MKQLVLVGCMAMMWLTGFSQKKYTVETYIDEFKYIAMEEMDESGIPASITLAQGILESGYGNSELSLKSNNHFGIKCHSGWSGKKTYYDDDRKGECFRVYKDPEDSYRDHSEFLLTRSRYDFLFNYSSRDYKKWAHGLKKAGYATNPKYGHLLVDLIEKHQLYLYDRPGRNAIARNEHNDRNNHHEVNSSRDYKPHENTVHTASSVNGASVEAVFSYNRIRTVAVGKYDDIRTIAERNYLPVKRLMKYNDLKPGEALHEGQLVYLQPKRGRSDKKMHIVKGNETMWDISQQYGVKLYKIRSRNLLSEREEPAAGETVYLNKKANRKPTVRSYQQEMESRPDQVQFEMADAGNDVKEVIIRREKVSAPTSTTKADPPEEQPMPKLIVVKEEVEKTTAEEDYEPVAVPRPKTPKAEEKAEVKTEVDQPEPSGHEKEDALVEKQVAKAPVAANRKVHTVKKGDTLYSISKLYTISVEDLKTWNKLADNLISIEQILIVSE